MANSKAPGGDSGRWMKSQLIEQVTELQRQAASLEEAIETYRSAAEEMKESETRLAEAQRMASIGKWDRNYSTDKVFWSDEMFQIFGLRKENFQPKLRDYFDSIHPDDGGVVESEIEDAIQHCGSYRIEHRIVLPDAEVRRIILTGEAYFDSEGREIRRRGTIQDDRLPNQPQHYRRRFSDRPFGRYRRQLYRPRVRADVPPFRQPRHRGPSRRTVGRPGRCRCF